ncbi:MAG: M20/M25/M40 family metallo-hydrolase [Chitinispirillales bacterium]|nr:M20/M25/M40 family metallo-hydrolase [Chitinispirillales bacterium]
MMDISRSLIDLTLDLVATNSVIGNEKELADTVFDIFSKNELKIERVGNSITARLDMKKEKTIALVGHLDTVPQNCKQSAVKIENDNLTGLGSCDMKSGIACALKILYEIKTGIIKPSKNIVFVFYDGEEGPLPNGITRLISQNKLQNIDFAYVLEPTCSKYSVGCLGTLTVKVEICGISAHSANPKIGENALSKAAEIIRKIEKIDAGLSKPQKIDKMSFYETINVTQISTENASNVIPQKVNLTINFRFSPKRSSENAKEFIYSIIDKNSVYFMDCANSCSADLQKTAEFLQNGVEREIMQAWTDIAQLNAAGISAVNFGAGDIKFAHKPEEFVSISALEKFYELLKLHV